MAKIALVKTWVRRTETLVIKKCLWAIRNQTREEKFSIPSYRVGWFWDFRKRSKLNIEQRKRKNDDITFFQIKVFFEGPKVLKLLCKRDYVIQSFTLIFGS